MAAIATQKLGAFASDASERIGEATNKVRSENKETFDNLDKQCAGVSAILRVVWNETYDLATSAFFPYLLVTFVLNIPPFAWGLASLFSNECNSEWLFFNSFLTAMHMGTSVYTVQRIRETPESTADQKSTTPTTETEATTVDATGESETPYVKVDANGETTNNNTEPTPAITSKSARAMGPPNSWQRIRMVMCYDMVMAVYYLMCVVWMLWQAIGTRRVVTGEAHQACSRWVVLSVIFGFLYLGLGVLAWTCSLCFLRYYKLQQQRDGTSSKEVLVMDEADGVSLA